MTEKKYMMLKTEYGNPVGLPRTVYEFARDGLENSGTDGALESLNMDTQNLRRAMARLLSILHERKEISLSEVFRVVNGFDPGEYLEER